MSDWYKKCDTCESNLAERRVEGRALCTPCAERHALVRRNAVMHRKDRGAVCSKHCRCGDCNPTWDTTIHY